MFRKIFAHAGMLLVAGAVVLATADPAWAQRGGGRGGGGGGARGGHVGSGRVESFPGGRFHDGGFHDGRFPGRDFHRGEFDRNQFEHRRFYPNFGYYPFYNSYDYPYSSYSYPDYPDVFYDDSGSYNAYSTPVQPPAQPDTTAHVIVNVPADAEVWFQGHKTTTTGAVREFQSPPLALGHEYAYDIRARWNENGQEVTQTQEVAVAPGAHVMVNFPVAAGTENH